MFLSQCLVVANALVDNMGWMGEWREYFWYVQLVVVFSYQHRQKVWATPESI